MSTTVKRILAVAFTLGSLGIAGGTVAATATSASAVTPYVYMRG